MSTTKLPSRVDIQERGETVVDCPSTIAEQLQKAAFDQKSTDVFVKTREPANGGSEYQVVEAQIEGDQLRISVEDIVGVVNLTPSSKLQIEPKIGWDEILEMFLTVNRYDRTLEYHGVPVDEFLADDVSIEDIFLVIAVNYLNSLEPLYERGFIRDFNLRHVDAVDARGRIDIERSLMNHATGVPKQHFVQKEVDYNTKIHSLIHRAGDQLLRLFQQNTDQYNHSEYYRIFSALQKHLRHLENLGITSGSERVLDFKKVSSDSLPRQRQYYERAIKVSKMILSSSTGKSLATGDQELTIDYILDMDQLFEQYTQVVFERTLDELKSNSLYSGLEKATIGKETIRPFEDTKAAHRPDHVIQVESQVVAVADTKYYDEGEDPTLDSYSRSRMISYAHLLNTDQMAFICPLGLPRTRTIEPTDEELRVVSPDIEFSTSSFKAAIEDYLYDILSEYRNESTLLQDLERRDVCHRKVSASSVDEVIQQGELRVRETVQGSQMIRYAVTKESDVVHVYREVDKSRRFYLQQRAKKIVRKQVGEYDYFVPVFFAKGEDEYLRIHFFNWERGEVTEHEVKVMELEWM